MMAAIEVQDLAKSFFDQARGVVRAVDGVSFSCERGEIVGLLGPNGAGKTTAIRLLASVLSPTGGRATVAGFDVQTQGLEVRKHIGYLTGGTGLYKYMTPIETLRFFGDLHGVPTKRLGERIEHLVKIFGIEEFQNSLCKNLSTGQKQRVNLARTVVHDPPVLILDEPTAGLDIASSSSILDFVRRSKDEGRCVLFSTHNCSEIELLCDRVAILNRGKLLACEPGHELLRKSGHPTLVHAVLAMTQADEPPSN